MPKPQQTNTLATALGNQSAEARCSRKERPAIYHERVFKLGGVSAHLATPPCLLDLATSSSLSLGLRLVVVKIQHGSPALMPPCALSCSC